MSKANNLTDFLTDVASAIRNKKGTTAKINPQDFSSEIESIQTSPRLQKKDVMPGRSTQTVTPNSGYDGLLSVTVYGDINLVDSNIKSGVSIFGIAGTYVGDGGAVVYGRIFNNIY